MRVTVIGYGPSGQATAKSLRRLGHEVQVQDADPELQSVANGHGFPSSLIRPDVTFICVPTSLGRDGLLDPSAIREMVVRSHGVVAVRSSVPVGFIRSLPDAGRVVYVPFMGDRAELEETEGSSPHIVLGAESLETATFVRNLWPPGVARMVQPEEAEIAVLSLHAYLALQASFAHMLEAGCQRFGADFHQVAYTLRCDQRVGMSANLKLESWGQDETAKEVLHLMHQMGSPRLLEAMWSSDEARAEGEAQPAAAG